MVWIVILAPQSLRFAFQPRRLARKSSKFPSAFRDWSASCAELVATELETTTGQNNGQRRANDATDCSCTPPKAITLGNFLTWSRKKAISSVAQTAQQLPPPPPPQPQASAADRHWTLLSLLLRFGRLFARPNEPPVCRHFSTDELR